MDELKRLQDEIDRLRKALQDAKCAAIDHQAKADKEIARLLKIAKASGRIPSPPPII